MILVFGHGVAHIRLVVQNNFLMNADGKKFEGQHIENKGNDNDYDKSEKQLDK